ncbi:MULTISPECIES: toxin-antitoxin system, antitoxin component, Xre family protein [unclassified Nodularia (in: cyanobacteria)]|uniref:toxin-antitoxin system, antitoxin component, Xre family protein n=1 Tax=unclassified Nodularia (in: cyanobacteria) TaxID=2656917 RepID=UPI00188255D5|nr:MULTISPECIES: toxin-antitoxin system, antitoxin component, Xre family protein [unclassified Nodularia (in: cyanobacteria)]MBE9201761.1 toxin-antitoxin system, antitoxin component, Xre family protein [Nodularia sp. LEGE 06071]MCC2694973.1 toxin-antitoxin system, antitoxin component, Xre family protein [Nodularia sp. LEGE 04288]
MHTEDRLKQKLWEKISQMPPENILLVTDFIDSLDQPNSHRMLTLAAAKLSEPALQKVWDHPDDAEYDQL